jgi:hypothetical protein
MPFLSKMIRFRNNLFHRRQVERDLNDELQAYVDEMTERRIQAGLTLEAARESVLLELGGIDRIKDLVRQQRIGFGNLRSVGLTAIVALVAFVSGVSAAAGVLRWKAPAPLLSTAAPIPVKAGSQHLPVLEGRLVDNATGQPIPFVEIALKQFPIRRFTYSDDTGNFFFTNPPVDPYGLEAGQQYWSVNEGGSAHFTSPDLRSEDFEFLGPSMVSVKSKNGEPSGGERVDFHSVSPAGKSFPPPGRELRRFRYDSSVIELRAENLSPGKLASR